MASANSNASENNMQTSSPVFEYRGASPRMDEVTDSEKIQISHQQCVLAREIGTKLKLPMYKITTAWIYIHRLYSRLRVVRLYSHVPAIPPIEEGTFPSFRHLRLSREDHDFDSMTELEVATAMCINVVSNVGTHPISLLQIMNTKNQIIHGRVIPGLNKPRFKAAYVKAEHLILQVLGFDLFVDQPHARIVEASKTLFLPQEFSKSAYFLATNILMITDLIVKVSATDFCAVCINITQKWTGFQIPLSMEGIPWYKYLNYNLTDEILREMTDYVMKAIRDCPEHLKKSLTKCNAMTTNKAKESSSQNEESGGQSVPEAMPTLDNISLSEPSATSTSATGHHAEFSSHEPNSE